MRRLTWSALFLALFSAFHAMSATLPLTFHGRDASTPPLLHIASYELDESPEELRFHLNADDAKALRALTAKHVGQTLVVKQGERVLASPTVRAAITGQDFVLSLKK